MADLIDRQAALDAISAWRRDYPLDLQEPIDDCWNSVRELPAVQPDHVADISKKVCVDAISRQETIHVISDWIYDTTDERLPETVIRSLPSVQPKTHWNPCSERLPEEGQKCLVCDKGGIGIDTYIGHGNPYNWKWYTRDYEAWMPLPEPYGGGEK